MGKDAEMVGGVNGKAYLDPALHAGRGTRRKPVRIANCHPEIYNKSISFHEVRI